MNPREEFLKHAGDCEQMAKSTRDPASKLTWNRMAERWRSCASSYASQRETVDPQYAPAKRHRQNLAPGWAPR
jgi:hypothetical protein